MSDQYPRLRRRPVLVVGATGFLGRAVVRELLANEVHVVALVRDRAATAARTEFPYSPHLHVIRGRIEDSFRIYSALAVHEIGAVFHLAACPPSQPDRGTSTVLEAVQRYDPLLPVAIPRPAAAAPFQGSANVVGVARFGELYGGGDRNVSRIVPATVMALLSGERTPLVAETPRRDFVFVQEAARNCAALVESLMEATAPRVEDRSYRSGIELNDREMAAAIRDVFEDRESGCAAALRDGLAATIAWYREFLRSRFFGTKSAAPPLRAAA